MANGGRHHFITFLSGEDPTFKCLLDRALDIFFMNGFNYFGEYKYEVQSTILDSSELLVDLTDKLSEFIKERELFPSRTYFYLKTSPKEENNNSVSDGESDGDDILNNLVFEQKQHDTSGVKWKVCTVCAHTYIDDCLHCEQNKEFEDALERDRAIQQNSISSVPHIDSESESEELDTASLRERRIAALSPPLSKNKPGPEQKNFDSLKELLHVMTENFLNNSPELTFQVCCRCILTDVLNKMKIFFSDRELCKIKVEFVSFSKAESGVDIVGPGKELFALLYEQAVGILLEGELGQHVLLHDLVQLENRDFFSYGQCIALAILHGYNPPHQFCMGLSGFIIGYTECLCNIQDIPDTDARQRLIDIQNCKTKDSFQRSLSDLSEQFEHGYINLNPAYEMKADILKKIAHHFIISRNMEEIQQLVEGLSCGNVLDALCKFPEEGMDLLVYNEHLVSYKGFKSLLEPQFSTNEAFKSEREEDVFYNFLNFLDEVGNKRLDKIMVHKFEDVEDGIVNSKMVGKSIFLPGVLQFFTGSRHLSRFGGKIKVVFDHSVTGRVRVSTCNLEVVFPTTENYAGPNVSKYFIDDLVESPGLGLV